MDGPILRRLSLSRPTWKPHLFRLVDALALAGPWGLLYCIPTWEIFALVGIAIVILMLIINLPSFVVRYAISGIGLTFAFGVFIAIPLSVLCVTLVAYIFDVDLNIHSVDCPEDDDDFEAWGGFHYGSQRRRRRHWYSQWF